MQIKNSLIVTLVILGLSPVARGDLIDDQLDDGKSGSPTSPTSTTPQSPPPKGASPAKTLTPVPGPTKKPAPPSTGKVSKGKKKSENEPIFWNGDGLSINREQGIIDLNKNVVVNQGDFHLDADQARVFLNPTTQEVIKIVATGNVKMTKIDPETRQEVRSQSKEATFMNQERVVVLKGDARLWKGDDMAVKGKQITYEMVTGVVRADKVEGMVTPEKK